MQNRGLKTLIIGTALVPSLVIAVLLGSYLAFNRIHDLRMMARERAETGAMQLALLAQRPLQAGDADTLQQLASLTLEERGVRGVAILDARGHVIAAAGGTLQLKATALSDAPARAVNDDFLQIAQPISSQGHYTAAVDAGATDVDVQPQGWVVIKQSHAPYLIQSYQAVLVAGLIIIATIIATIAFAVFASSRLDNSFATLRAGIGRFRAGRFDAPITLDEDNELNALGEDINELAATLQNASIDLQRTLEQANRDLRESLETVEVQNIELDLARREALAASRIKSEFLANTSHELRTPLNGIIGFTKLLLKSALDSRQREYLETIRYSAENLLTIINDILDFSKIEAGKLVLDSVPLNLREVIEETLSILAPGAFEKGLDLILLYDDEVPADLVGDPLRLRQILTNLISNAVKFTSSGHIVVRVSLSDTASQRVPIKISVTDTGIGLSEAQQRQLFRAFMQGDASTSRVFGGTGLGLAISKRLIEQMGGEIGLESQIGQGSTFWMSLRLPIQANPLRTRSFDLLKGRRLMLYDSSALSQLALRQLLESWHIDVVALERLDELDADFIVDGWLLSLKPEELSQGLADQLLRGRSPVWVLIPALTTDYAEAPGRRLLMKPVGHLALYDALCAALEPTRSVPLPLAPPPPTAIRVLAVDDNVANLKLLGVLLEERGIQADVAASGRQALGTCDRQRFDLILMDLQMPGMSGLQVTRLIRQGDSPNRDTRIVALTAHLLPEEQRQLLAEGFDLCLTKPLNDDQLDQLLGIAASPRANAATSAFQPSTLPAPAAMGTPATRHVDVALCLQRARHNGDLAGEMLAGVLDGLADMQKRLAAWPTPQLLDEVHKLHGACCYTGLPALQQAAHDLEDVLKQSPADEKAAADARHRLGKAIAALLDWREKHDIAALFDEAHS